MVKQTVVNKPPARRGRPPKNQQKVNKIIVQITRVPDTKATKVKKSKKDKDDTTQDSEKRKYRKYERKKNLDENGEKFKFSIVDYLRTSMSDKLGVEEIKKLQKEERKAKKLNGKLPKNLNAGNDFGSYELLDNDPDDFMIPLDVVITTDPSAPEEESAITNSEEGVTPMDASNSDSNISELVSRDETSEFNDSGILNADCFRNAYKEILDSSDVVPEKGPKGTHFLLTDASKSCELCGASFTCAYKLKRHMLSHSDERKFFCDRCGSGFKTSYHLSRHKTNVHSIISVYSCDLCDKEFTTKPSLKEHKFEQHPSIVKFLCSVCQKSFASRKGLKRHEKQLHRTKM